MIVVEGSTNVTVPMHIVEDVGGTNPGEPKTGLLFSDIETGGSASYQRQGAARVDFTLVTQTVAGAHTDGGFIEVDATNMPGTYRLDVPDAAFAAGADFVIITIIPASGNNALARPLKVDLVSVDLRDSVRAGLTSLPNAAAEAAGGLYTRGTGAGQIDQPANGQIDVNVAAFDAGAITAAAVATGAIDADALATDAVNEIRDAITGGAYAFDTDANGRVRIVDGTAAGEIDTSSGRVQITTAQEDAIVDKVWDELQSGHVTAGSFGEMATEVAAILVDTTEIGTAGAGLSNIPWNASWDAEVESEVNDGLVALHLDHLLAADYDPAAKPGTATALLNEMVENDAGVSRFTANALEQAPAGGGGGTDWTSGEREQIRQALGITGTKTATSGGNLDDVLADTNELQGDWANGGRLDLILDARASQATADAIELDTQDIQGRLPAALVSGRMDSSVGAMAANTLNASALATDAVNEVRDAITGGAYALDTDANGRVRIVDGVGVGELDTSSGTVTVGTNNDKTGYSISGTKTTLDALNDLSAAQVNAEVVDVITVDTIPELAQAKPAATPTLASGMMLLYMALRNKIDQTNSLFEIHNNAGTQIATKSVSDDGTTYSEAQMAAGT